jgi:hypothetical protein
MKILKVLALCLASLSVSAQEAVDVNNWFPGATKYKETGENIRINWTPSQENASWEGVYVFDLDIINYQRQQVVITERALNQLYYDFTLDRVGHYIVRLRTCLASDTSNCSEWTNTWETSVIQYNGETIDSWWIFIWLSAPTGPGVS